MYRCKVCQTVVGPKLPRRVHVVYREIVQKVYDDGEWKLIHKREVSREIPLCNRCYGLTELGCTLEQVVEQRGREREHKPEEVVRTNVAFTPRPVSVGVQIKPLALMGVPVVVQSR